MVAGAEMVGGEVVGVAVGPVDPATLFMLLPMAYSIAKSPKDNVRGMPPAMRTISEIFVFIEAGGPGTCWGWGWATEAGCQTCCLDRCPPFGRVGRPVWSQQGA